MTELNPKTEAYLVKSREKISTLTQLERNRYAKVSDQLNKELDDFKQTLAELSTMQRKCKDPSSAINLVIKELDKKYREEELEIRKSTIDPAIEASSSWRNSNKQKVSNPITEVRIERLRAHNDKQRLKAEKIREMFASYDVVMADAQGSRADLEHFLGVMKSEIRYL